MATYDLKYPGAAIDAILDTAYDLQNAGYIFRGLASEYSNTPTERSWVLAGEGETGHGFTSPIPKGYIGVCVFNGTSWTGKLLKCVSIDSTPTDGSTNAVSSGGAYASISQLADTVTEALDNLTFTDTTPSAFLGEYIIEKVSTTDGGIERILTYFTILAATTSKAGLLSAADKAKLDAILGNLRSLEIDDTTAYSDLGDKIVESIKATIGGTEETISTFQILAATASKAGLLSAADKAKLDAMWSSGYQFAGIATPSTTPLSTTSKIFYIATEAGTYFNAVTVTQGINILSWNGTAWSAVQVVGIDKEPVIASHSLVEGGGVYRQDEILRHRVDGDTIMQPFETVEGKFINSSGSETSNNNFSYQKYVVLPKHRYMVSGKITNSSTTLYAINWFDVNGNYIDHDAKLADSVLVLNNEPVNSPSNAYYAYVNVSNFNGQAYMLADYPHTLPEVNDLLAKRAFGLDKVTTINNVYFKRSQGLNPVGSVVVAKFAVTPNTRYLFKINIPVTTLGMYLISYLDENGDYTTGSPSLRVNPGEAVEIDTEIKTSSTCRYVYINIPKVAIDSVVFGYLSEQEENDTILPGYVSQIPYEVIEGKYVGLPASGETAPEEKTLASMKYSKYTLEQNKKYVANYTISARTTVYMMYYVDANGDYISRALHNATGNVMTGNVILNVPSNAAGIYINEGVSGGSVITLNEVSTTDRTEEILGYLNKNGICRLGAGDYYINALNMPDNTTLVGDGKNTRLILSGTSDGYAIRVGARCTISDLQIDGNANLEYKGEENLSVDEIHMDGNRHGILLLGDGENPNWAGSVITRCEITNFSGGGITCDNTGYGTYSSLTVSDCWIRHCCVGINVAYFSEFNKFVNIGCYDCRYGCVNNGGNNSFDTCGFNHNQIGFYINGNDGKCIRYDGTTINGRNMGHGVMANCILDHNGKDNSDVGYAIVVIGVSQGYQFANLSIHYGKLYFEGNNNISLVNGKLGQNTGWEIRNMVTPIVISSFVGVASSYTPFAVYINDQLITDFDADGNGGFTYMYNCFRYRTKATPQYLMSL